MGDAFKIVFAGGGTGGHLYPALALAREIENRYADNEILFFGTERGIESRIIPELGYNIEFINIRGIQRSLTLKNLKVPFLIIRSLITCRRVLRRFKPAVVIGTGGYVSWPVLFTASLLGYPTVIQEQNSYPGISTRFLSRFVDHVHLSFEESFAYIKKGKHVFMSGNPIRSSLTSVNRETAAANLGLSIQSKTLLIFGGSQGAHSINMAVINIIHELMRLSDWQIMWGTGEKDFNQVSTKCEQYGHRIIVKPYLQDMASVYALSDLVISRAGATTLAELQSCKLAALLIPYPYAAAGHQEANARALVSKNAVEMVLDENLNDATFLNKLINLMNDDDHRRMLGINLGKLAQPDAAVNIINKTIELIENVKNN